MNAITLSQSHVLMYGCGKMGSAMLKGWLAGDLNPDNVTVIDPHVSADVTCLDVNVNQTPSGTPDIVVLAVKPQMANDVLPLLLAFLGPNTLLLSVMAGTSLTQLGSTGHPSIVRAMPNTPAAVSAGITALVANDGTSDTQRALAEHLMSAVGQCLWLSDESQMDAVTGLSGSGPAYVFHMVEAMAAAGEAQGLPADMAMQLARATVAGAGTLLAKDPTTASILRENVTSPGGTTQAGLELLMDAETGLSPLMNKTVAAAANRSRELGDE